MMYKVYIYEISGKVEVAGDGTSLAVRHHVLARSGPLKNKVRAHNWAARWGQNNPFIDYDYMIIEVNKNGRPKQVR